MQLSGKDRHHLRALGHPLKPILQIGKEGVTEAFSAALDQALRDHELIKVRVLGNAPLEREEAADELARAANAEVAQVLGNLVLLYRPHPDEPTIVLPGLSKKKRSAVTKPKIDDSGPAARTKKAAAAAAAKAKNSKGKLKPSRQRER
jgi:RNA-binding protein